MDKEIKITLIATGFTQANMLGTMDDEEIHQTIEEPES